MRLVYLFVSDGAASTGSNVPWSEHQKAENAYITNGMPTEGFFYLFERLLTHKVVQEVIIVVESTRGTGSFVFPGSEISAHIVTGKQIGRAHV